MKALLATLLLLQAAPVQSDADKLEAALKKFGDRNYSIFVNGEKVGSCELKCRIEKNGGQPLAVLEERSTWTWMRDSTATKTEKATMDRLRLVSSRMTLKSDEKEETMSVLVDGTKAVMQVEGKERTIEVSKTAVGELGAIRLVCAAEQKVGASFTVDVLDVPLEQFQPGHSFNCIGREQIVIGDKKVDAFKWENKGEWKLAKKAGDKDAKDTWRVHHTYWVSPEGYLLRFDNGDLTVWVLDSK